MGEKQHIMPTALPWLSVALVVGAMLLSGHAEAHADDGSPWFDDILDRGTSTETMQTLKLTRSRLSHDHHVRLVALRTLQSFSQPANPAL